MKNNCECHAATCNKVGMKVTKPSKMCKLTESISVTIVSTVQQRTSSTKISQSYLQKLGLIHVNISTLIGFYLTCKWGITISFISWRFFIIQFLGILLNLGHSRPLILYIRFSYRQLKRFLVNKCCRWLDSNPGPLVSDATKLSTVQQPLPTKVYSKVQILHHNFAVLFILVNLQSSTACLMMGFDNGPVIVAHSYT